MAANNTSRLSRLIASSIVGAFTLLALAAPSHSPAALKKLSAATSTSAPAYGPSGPVGPATSLTAGDRELLSHAVRVASTNPADLLSAISTAQKSGHPTVFLPAGRYTIEAQIRITGPLTLIGDGGRSIMGVANKKVNMFHVEGNDVRFTRLTLAGADTTFNAENNTWGISAVGAKGMRIDHCEISGFSYATYFEAGAVGQVDHCLIHHNARDGLGYGVCVVSGAQVLVSDNDFSENRHSLASNGALDWGDVQPGGVRKHLPGFAKTHWEFIHNRVHGDSVPRINQAAVDAHPGMDGTFRISGNDFSEMRFAIGLMDGSGVISENRFHDFHGWQPAAIWIFSGPHNGIPVEAAMPHDIDVRDNAFDAAFADDKTGSQKYRIEDGRNIAVDEQIAPKTRANTSPQPQVPILVPIEDK